MARRDILPFSVGYLEKQSVGSLCRPTQRDSIALAKFGQSGSVRFERKADAIHPRFHVGLVETLGGPILEACAKVGLVGALEGPASEARAEMDLIGVLRGPILKACEKVGRVGALGGPGPEVRAKVGIKVAFPGLLS